MPKVFTSNRPAELILVTGEPKYTPVAGTGLQWVSNTESDVFRLGTTGAVYYLVAGRWFSAPDFTGPWTFATPSLPADFKKISLEHPRSRVLASVPGTDQAAEAVLLAADSADRAREPEGDEGARRRVPGQPGVHADRVDHRRACGQHRQGCLQDRRCVLHVLPGSLVHRQGGERSLGGRDAPFPSRSTRSLSALPLITSPT